MRRLIKYLRGFAIVAAIIAPLMMMLEVSMDLLQPKLMADIIDIGVAKGDTSYVLITGGKMILVAVLGFIGGSLCSVFAAIAAMHLGEKLRYAIFEKIQSLSFKEIDKFKTSSLITRLTNDVVQVQNMMLMALRIMVRAPLICLGGLLMAISLSKELSLIFLVAIPLILIAVGFIINRSYPLFLTLQEKIDKINIVVRESILGVRVIKAFTMEGLQEDRFENVNSELMDSSILAQNMNMVLWPVVTFVMNLSVIAVLWVGGNMFKVGNIEIGKIMAFINYLLQIMGSLMMVIMIVMNYSRARASAERINEVLDSTSSIEETTSPQKMSDCSIEFKNVSFRYNEHSEYVLKDISFKAEACTKIGIIGSTGSGKSSLTSLIPRLYDVTEGEVIIGGVNVKELSSKELRDNIGVVLQDSIIFSGTIEDNLKFGAPDASFNDMVSAAEDAQAYEFISGKENTFHEVIEQRGKNLSGGQKQRLSIARTLARNPKILILDDSSSALDMATEAKLQASLKNRMKASTMLIIAQRISAVDDSDQIIVLDDGRISGIGSHKELLKTNEIYRSIAVSQLGEEVLING